MWLQVINKVKVTHQGESHIQVKVKYLYPFKFYVAHTLCKWMSVCLSVCLSVFLSVQAITFEPLDISISLQILCSPYSLQVDVTLHMKKVYLFNLTSKY